MIEFRADIGVNMHPLEYISNLVESLFVFMYIKKKEFYTFCIISSYVVMLIHQSRLQPPTPAITTSHDAYLFLTFTLETMWYFNCFGMLRMGRVNHTCHWIIVDVEHQREDEQAAKTISRGTPSKAMGLIRKEKRVLEIFGCGWGSQ